MSKRKLSEREKKFVSSLQDWKCGICKKSLPSSYQIDHIIPFSISYNDEIDNLMSLCPNCHANKTQNEYNRIIYFKKLKAEMNSKNLCWFCLEDEDKYEHKGEREDKHTCNRTLKPILKKNESKLNSNIDNLDKFNFVNMSTKRETKTIDSITNSFDSIKLDSTLRIKLQNSLIFVNSFFTPSSTPSTPFFSIEEIAKAVSIATRTKKDSKRYDEVEISINIGNIGEDKENQMIDLLNDNLPELLPNRIFKDGNINYTYLIN